MAYAECNSFEKRFGESQKILEKYPGRIPVICEKANRSNLPNIEKSKFLVPSHMLVGEFKYVVQRHVLQALRKNGNTAEKVVYLFVNNTTPNAASAISDIYQRYHSDDGFLYISYSSENALGA